MHQARARALLIFVVVAVVGIPSLVAAQPFVNPKGELQLQLHTDFQTADGVWHGSTLVTGLTVNSFNESFAAEYVPIDKLAIGGTLFGNGVEYTGPQSIPNLPYPLAHGSQDDGSLHWNVTDLELDARYQVYDDAFTFTPLIRGRIPVKSYENKGYAAAGSDLKEAGIGFAIGKYGLGTDDLVLQAEYTFTYVEKYDGGGAATEKYRVNRSDADVILTYQFTDKLIAGIAAAFRYTHDGFDLADYANLDPTDPLIKFHDPVLKVMYFAPMGLASYQFNDHWALQARVAKVALGSSTSDPLSIGLTLTWVNNLLSH